MKKKVLQNFSDQELLTEYKKRKKEKNTFGSIVSILVGVAIMSTYRKGVTFSTFIPFFFLPLVFSYFKNQKEAERELKSRNLNYDGN